MAKHIEIGRKGEKLAAEYLIQKGYSLLETNWRHRKGEIDLIMKFENNLVFVEVKTRSRDKWNKPEEAIDRKKRKLLIETADAYLQTNSLNLNSRFDIISIILKNTAYEIEHFENAIIPDLD
ncbi:MAG: YraN family protein [Bacteroidales bacterium]|nr:YraN family protein [Bacteroidales bacterium]